MKRINIDFKVEKNGKLVKVQSEESVPTKTSELENDSGFITQAPETAIDNQTITKNSTNELQTIGIKYNDNLITAEMIYNATHYIRYKEEPTKEAGLYVDGVLSKTWAQLISDGDVTIEYQFRFNNKDLTGDLICGNVENFGSADSSFYQTNLNSIDVSKLDTSNVTNMQGMFGRCSKLTNLDLSNFDTSNVTDMSFMFLSCSSLTSLDISNFTFDKVTSYSNMFGSVPDNCEILVKSQTEKDWITSKFTNLTNVKIKGGEEITDLAGTTWQFKDIIDTSMITNSFSPAEASLNLAGDTTEFKRISLYVNTSPVKAMITDNSWEKIVRYINNWSNSSTTATLPPKVTFNVYNKASYDNAQQWEEFIAFLKANATQEV